MGRLGAFLSLPAGDEARLVTAAVLLVSVSVAVVLVPLSRVHSLLLSGSGATARVVPGSPPPGRVAWAVRTADRHLPGDRTCLVRSLSTETLLRLYGYAPVHRIGVDRNAEDDLEAHSWIEYDGEVLIGDVENLSRFEQLPPLSGQDRL